MSELGLLRRGALRDFFVSVVLKTIYLSVPAASSGLPLSHEECAFFNKISSFSNFSAEKQDGSEINRSIRKTDNFFIFRI